ncbi:MAG: NAD(P)(+) transhydrogenase (Re/Si-specific) subunit beta [Fimbriimonadaceae bacterium]
MNADVINVCYLLTAVTFMLALKLMNGPKTARLGNLLAAGGMALAIAATFFIKDAGGRAIGNLGWIALAFVIGSVLGAWSARRVQMTAMPQMVALFNGLGGGAVALVALVEYPHLFASIEADTVPLVTTVLSLVIGSVSFSGSMVAYGKLQEILTGRPITWPLQKFFNFALFIAVVAVVALLMSGVPSGQLLYVLLGLALLLGVTLVLPIGGADMPVVISLLNSFTGCAAGLAGFVLDNTALLIGGGLVGASGLILTLEMCKAMNRPLSNVVFGAFGGGPAAGALESAGKTGSVRSYSVEDAAIIFSSADSVIIVPGYGMAVAQAQHVVKELAEKLTARGIDVKFAIHPVAGRMPGHMNVLLAEADVPYEQLYDLDEINSEFPETDVALVIGANDVVNPAARYDKASPIYGMPILDVDKARTVIVSKRSMSPGFAGIDNELFISPNTIMVFGNAKTTIAKLSAAMDSM